MALEVGARLGHHAITALVGEGGIGEARYATGAKLNHHLALKVLSNESGQYEIHVA